MTTTRTQLQARWRYVLACLATATDPLEISALHRELLDVEAEAVALTTPPGFGSFQGGGPTGGMKESQAVWRESVRPGATAATGASHER